MGAWIKFLKSRESEGMGEVWTNNIFFWVFDFERSCSISVLSFYHKLDNFFLFFHYMFVYLFPLHSPLPFSFQDWQNHLWVWNQSETGLKPQTSLYSQHFAHSFLSLFFLFFLFIVLLSLFFQVFLAFPCVSPFSFLFPALVVFTSNVRLIYPFPFLFPVLVHCFPFIFHFLFLLILFFLLVLHRAPPPHTVNVPRTQGKTLLKVCNKSETSLKQLAPDRREPFPLTYWLSMASLFPAYLPRPCTLRVEIWKRMIFVKGSALGSRTLLGSILHHQLLSLPCIYYLLGTSSS